MVLARSYNNFFREDFKCTLTLSLGQILPFHLILLKVAAAKEVII